MTILEGNPPPPTWAGWEKWFGFPVSGVPAEIVGQDNMEDANLWIPGLKDNSPEGYCHEQYEDSWERKGEKDKIQCYFYPSAMTEFRNSQIPANTYRDLMKSPPSVRAPYLHGIPGRGKAGELVFEAYKAVKHITDEEIKHRPGDQYIVIYDADKKAGGILAKVMADGRRVIIDNTDCMKREAGAFAVEIADMIRRNEAHRADVSFYADPAARTYLYGTTTPFFKEIEEVCNRELRMDATHRPLKAKFNDPKARHSTSNAVLNMFAPGSGLPLVQVHKNAARVVHALENYGFKESETHENDWKFDKSDNKIATFGDCFTYFAQIVALDCGSLDIRGTKERAIDTSGGYAFPEGRDRDPDPLLHRAGKPKSWNANEGRVGVGGLEKVF